MATTKVLFERHEEHNKREGLELLLLDAQHRAINRGKALAKGGVKIDAVYTSPRPRAVSTALTTVYGNGTTPNFAVEKRVGDFKADPRTPADGMKKLKGLAIERYGDDSDANLARAMLELSELHEFMQLRAKEGAEALLEIAAANPGKTVLVTSHGVARMELVLRHLRGIRGNELIDIVGELIDRGEIVECMFEVESDVPGSKTNMATFISATPLTLLAEDPAEAPTFRGDIDPAAMKTVRIPPAGQEG